MLKKLLFIAMLSMVIGGCKGDNTPASLEVSTPTTTATVTCSDPHLQGIMTWTAATIDTNGIAAAPDGYIVSCSSSASAITIDAGNVVLLDLSLVLVNDESWACKEKAYSKDPTTGDITRDGEWSNEVLLIRQDGCFY